MYDYQPVYRDETDRASGHSSRIGTTALMIWLINCAIFMVVLASLPFFIF